MNFFRSILMTFSLIWAVTCASAQGFSKTYAPGYSTANDVVHTSDGGFFMAGFISNDSLLFLQRVDAQGNIVWANHVSQQRSRAIAVAKTSDGGFVVLTENYVDAGKLKNAVVKISGAGAVLWTTIVTNNNLPNGFRDIVATTDGGFLLAGDTRDANLVFRNALVKLDGNGAIAWQKNYGNNFLNTSRVVALSGGGFAISGGRNNGTLSLAKVNDSGDLVWENAYPQPQEQKAFDLLATADGGFVLLGTNQNGFQGRLEICLLKTDASGNQQWFKSTFPYAWPGGFQSLPIINGIMEDQAGNFYLPLWDNLNVMELLKTDQNGNALWKRELQINGRPTAIIPADGQNLAITGQSGESAFLMKLDGEGEVYFNKIRGTVYRDDNTNCAQDNGETGAFNFVVTATATTGETYFKRTNADGTYEIRVPEGNFSLSASPSFGPPGLYIACNTPAVTISAANPVAEGQHIGLETIAECPLLEVEIGGGILRRCVSTRYAVDYCNYGNLPATNATVAVTIDPALSLWSSSAPLVSQVGNVYTFSIGTVAVGDCDRFVMDLQVSCNANIGDIVCMEAHAYPDTTCLPPDANWDGSELEVTGVCEDDAIKFTIKNNGTAPMTQALDYVIIEDHIIYMQGSIQLPALSDSVLVVPNPDGACYLGKLFEQTSGVSIINKPTAVVENCIAGGNLSLALEFETGENNYAVSTSCNDIVGSYDPNDKRGFPTGWGPEHLLERNQELEYVIRFQNTGNDTAFLVVIRDTLPVATLNPATVRPIAASHPYSWDLTGEGIVTFTFPDILLPDSTTNEPASNGYVRFRIAQQPDLPDGTMILNSAAIYFDFNDPVITNEYFHTVGRPLVLATKNPGQTQLLDFQVQPNPFSAEATFVLKDFQPTGATLFRLLNAQGNVVREESFSGNTFLFNARNLTSGLYLFQMENAGALLTAGKVIIQH